MSAYPEERRIVRFGVFDADLDKRELRKNGVRIRLQEQPFQLLVALLEAHGEVVSRAELCDRLWPDTHVDFEECLNATVRRLRMALGDEPDAPRYIETVPRRGYRFTAPLEAEAPAKPRLLPMPARSPIQRSKWGRSWKLALLGAMFAAVVLLTAELWPASPHVLRIVPITAAGRVDGWASPVSDGPHIYFLQREGGRWITSQVAASGGDPQPLNLSFHDRNAKVLDASPDGTLLLTGTFAGRDDAMPLWIVPSVGGTPRPLGNVRAWDAVWSPSGREIAYSISNELHIISADGGQERTLATLVGAATNLAWSPDGRRIRFSVFEPGDDTPGRLWEVRADGSKLRPVLPGWKSDATLYSGSWTHDGRYYVFGVSEHTAGGVWAVRDDGRWPWAWPGAPVQLAGGPMNFGAPRVGRDGNRVILVGGECRNELWRYNTANGEFKALPLKRSMIDAVAFSPDGASMAYISQPDYNLWRTTLATGEQIQLTSSPLMVIHPNWSPDGSQIAVQSYRSGPAEVYLAPAAGGEAQRLLPKTEADAEREDPDWAPDSHSIAYALVRSEVNADSGIHIFDIRTRKDVRLPDSNGLWRPRWSPDGHFVAALTRDLQKLMLFNLDSHEWRQIEQGGSLIAAWSHTGRGLYYQDLLEHDQPIYLIHPGRGKPKRVMDFATFLAEGVPRCALAGVAADDSLMIMIDRGSSNLYALEWNAR